MALFSDVDWAILLAVGGFLVLGKDGGQVVRQMGRLYGRLARLKSELLGEFAKAADLPTPVPGQFVSIRQSLLQWEPGVPGRAVGVPVAVAAPPSRARSAVTAEAPSHPVPDWSPSYPGSATDPRRNN